MPSTRPSPQASSDPGDVPQSVAKTIYEDNCAVCHGAAGEGRVNFGPRIAIEWERAALLGEVSAMIQANNTNCGAYDAQSCTHAVTDYVLNNIALTTQSSPFMCERPLPAVDIGAKRLSRVEYTYSLWDILNERLGRAFANELIYDRDEGLERLVPPDLHDSGMREMDTRVALDYVEAWFTFSLTLAEAIETRIERFVGEACALNPNDKACMRRFITQFGRTLFSMPLSQNQINHYASAESYRELLIRLLNAPDFIYHTEFNGQDLDGSPEIRKLTAYELAERLSYTYWQSLPDATLLAAAENNEIENNYDRILDYVINHEKTRRGMHSFFEDWWQTNAIAVPSESLTRGLRQLDSDPDASRDTSLPLNFNALAYRDDALQELSALVDYVAWEDEGRLGDIYTNPYSFARSTNLAKAYGVAKWSGNFNETVAFPTEQRNGLITRAAFHLFGGERSNPILKGTRIRTRLLCDILPVPADNTPPNVEPQAHWNTRQLISAQTESTAGCAKCHQHVINPPGFATEDYDVLGRYRTEERFVSLDASDNPIIDRQVSLNLQVQPKIDGETDTREIHRGLELGQLLADSPKTAQCFSRMMFRHTHSRFEDDRADGCALSQVANTAQTRSLKEALRSVAEQPEFKLRRVTE